MKNVKIAGRAVGAGNSVYVIAEAGVNHDGRVEKAFALVDAACDAGADCVKFQTFKAERVATVDAQKARYQKALTDPNEKQIDMLRRLELSDEELTSVFAYCRKKNIQFMSTPYNREDVDLLERLGVEAYKLASISIAEPLLLSYVAQKSKPMIVSAGLATLAEIDSGLRTIRQAGNEDIVLLQCTTNYPADPAEANLRTVPAMQQIFDVVTGYSDHTESQSCCIAATALGASVIERHITLDRSDDGPDHAASSDPAQFKSLVDAIRETEAALGTGKKVPTSSELENIGEMRRSIVLRHDVAAGAVLTLDDLDFRRPGTGIRPDLAPLLEGASTVCDIQAGVHLDWSMVKLNNNS